MSGSKKKNERHIFALRPRGESPAQTPRVDAPPFDSAQAAAEVYSLSPDLRAVIVLSLLVIKKKRSRGPHRRAQMKVYSAAMQAVRDGNLPQAKRIIEDAAWPGPPTVWWVESEEELAARIAALHAVIEEPAGISDGLITNQVAFFDLFPD